MIADRVEEGGAMSVLLTVLGVLLLWILVLACLRIAMLGLVLALSLFRVGLWLVRGRG